MTQVTIGSPKLKSNYEGVPKNRVRFRDPHTGEYLHLSGSGRTRGTDYAWVGTRAQARALRDRALSEDRDWPYMPVKAKGGRQ